jgi:hypothetical protein
MRIDFSSIDIDGNFISVNDQDPAIAKIAKIEPPQYESGVYCTRNFIIDNKERDLIEIRHAKGKDLPLYETMKKIVKHLQPNIQFIDPKADVKGANKQVALAFG